MGRKISAATLGTAAGTDMIPTETSGGNPRRLTLADALGLFRSYFVNVAGTYTSVFSNTNTAARTYTFQNRNGTIADDTDLALKAALATEIVRVTRPTMDEAYKLGAEGWKKLDVGPH